MMRTRLGVFCDRLIEAGWLAAVIVAPLVFNVYSESVYEVNKVCILRSIALVMSLAWAVRTVEEQRGKPLSGIGLTQQVKDFLLRPLVLPALLLIGVYVLTTLTSIWPYVSLWGSYDRRQGTYTTLAYIAIFFLILQTLRTQEQRERLVTFTVLASLPVSLHAFIQHYELAPGPWGGAFGERVASSLGNPIFAAAYLIMVVPLTIRQAVKSFSALIEGRKSLLSRLIPVVFYPFVLVIQLLSIVFTQSRGPFLGLLGGLFFFFLLLAISKGKRGLALVVISLAVMLGLLLATLNLPNTPLAALRELPYVERLGTIIETSTFKVRILIWEGAVQMSTASLTRMIFGYGPETMDLAFYPYLSPALVQFEGPGRTADRAHNETLDALVTTGLIGVAVYLLLFGSLFYYGFKGLGLIGGRQQQTQFAALLAIGGALGVLLPWLLDGALRFAGVGIPAGMLAALVVYLVLFLLRRQKRETWDGRNQVLLIALLSAIVAHFIEIQSGIAVTTTRTTFWVYAALTAVTALPREGEPVPARSRDRWGKKGRRRSRGKAQTASVHRASLGSHALLIGLLLITLGFDFITPALDLRSNLAIVGLFVLVWLLGGGVVIAEADEQPVRIGSLLVYSLASLGCLLVFVPLHIASLRLFDVPANIALTYYLCLFLILITFALVLLKRTSVPHRAEEHGNGWLYPILAAVVIVLIFRTNLDVVRADIYSAFGRAYQEAGQWDRSIALYQWALELAPRQDHYYRLLGHAYLKKAQPVTGQREYWFSKAQEALERAKELSPLDPDHYGNLANLHHAWADVTDDPAEKAERLEVALSYYQQVLAMAPTAQGQILRDSIIEAHLTLADYYAGIGEVDRAIEEARAARDLAPAEQRGELDDFIAELENQDW